MISTISNRAQQVRCHPGINTDNNAVRNIAHHVKQSRNNLRIVFGQDRDTETSVHMQKLASRVSAGRLTWNVEHRLASLP